MERIDIVLIVLAALCTTTLGSPISGPNSFGIDIVPSHIIDGITKQLTVNCSFFIGSTHGMSSLISLILYHNQSTASSQTFLELASVNIFHSDHVEFLANVNATGTGSIRATGASYLCLQWDYPSQSQAGDYRCDAHGVDLYGHPIVVSAHGLESNEAIGLDVVLKQIREIDVHLENIDVKLNTFITDTEAKLRVFKDESTNTIKNLGTFNATVDGRLKNKKTSIGNVEELLNISNQDSAKKFKTLDEFDAQFTSRLERMKKSMLSTSSEHEGSRYMLSYHLEHNVDVCEAICILFGGYLAEIGNSSEHNFIKSFLKPFGHINVLIGITDEASEGNYKFRFSGKTAPYLDWDRGDGEPDGGKGQNCITLGKYGYRFFDTPCYEYKFRFLCEVPANVE